VGLVQRRSAWLAGLGGLIGGGFAGGAVKLLLMWSSGIRILEWDSAALLTGVTVAGAAAVLAAIGPSSRAARVDPNIVLRAD
jgi:ABC-type antimicrobial peptide transport system permease subunit